MSDAVHISPPTGALAGRVKPPGSKSLTNRALLLAALADGESTLVNPLVDADDSAAMIDALRRLGAGIEIDGPRVRIRGVGGRWRIGPGETRLDLRGAGTATRFLSAAAMLAPPGSSIVIDGNARMRQRPIGELSAMLRRLGCRVEHLGDADCPPVRITPPDVLPTAAVLDVPTTLSSQFVSALMLVSPWMPGGISLRFTGEVTSAGYVEMTARLLEKLGADPQKTHPGGLCHPGVSARRADLPKEGLRPFTLDIEPDASGATYFLAAAAVVPGSTVEIAGLPADSLQPDAGFARLLQQMGCRVAAPSLTLTSPTCLSPIDADLSLMPDAAMTLAVVCCFAAGPSRLTGLRTLRVKESDRLAAMQAELSKLGAAVTIEPCTTAGGSSDEAVVIRPSHSQPPPHPPLLGTYDDHRMAMSLAVAGLALPAGVRIADPGCVAKTYPAFWRDFASLTGQPAGLTP